MYRIEVAPGEETVFRTIEELATAIRNGLVTTRSRIFHGASQKWLPIEFHPHYKKALESLDRPRPAPGPGAAAAAPPPPVPAQEPDPSLPPRVAVPARQAVPVAAPASASWPAPRALEFIEVELPRISYPEKPAPCSRWSWQGTG